VKAILARAAVGDLAEIARHIGRDSVPAARRFTASLERRALAVSRNPRVFPFAEGLEDLKIRRRLYRDYLIFFTASKAGVQILRIVHGARDWRALFENRDAR
jgi:plasmid stabilization system protein ParE